MVVVGTVVVVGTTGESGRVGGGGAGVRGGAAAGAVVGGLTCAVVSGGAAGRGAGAAGVVVAVPGRTGEATVSAGGAIPGAGDGTAGRAVALDVAVGAFAVAGFVRRALASARLGTDGPGGSPDAPTTGLDAVDAVAVDSERGSAGAVIGASTVDRVRMTDGVASDRLSFPPPTGRSPPSLPPRRAQPRGPAP